MPASRHSSSVCLAKTPPDGAGSRHHPDSISVDFVWRPTQGKDAAERRMKIFDTAGLRKRANIHDKLEKLAAADALRAVRFADVVVLLLDATIPFEKQDLTIADLVEREGTGRS